MSQPENLVDTLALERLEVNLFRGVSPNEGPGRIFGGQVILSYASDMNLLSTAMRPHRVHWQTRNFQSASLDHAMWFHKPVRRASSTSPPCPPWPDLTTCRARPRP